MKKLLIIGTIFLIVFLAYFLPLTAIKLASLKLMLTAWQWLSIWNVCLVLVILVLCVFVVYQFARADIFFTLVKEGSAKAILYMGAFYKIVVQFKDCEIDPTTGNVKPGLRKKWKRIFGGLRWLGIPFLNSIYHYKFRWTTARPQSNELIKREERLDFILVRDDVYVVEVQEAESKGMVPLNFVLLLTMCSVNPYKSLFAAQDWSEMIFNRSEATFREFASTVYFEEIVQEKQDAGGGVKFTEAPEEKIKEILATAGKRLMDKLGELGLLEIFESEYGIKIKAIEMKSVQPGGEDAKEIQAAAMLEWKAEQRRKETIKNAEAERSKIDIVYKKIQEFGDLGPMLRFMESLDKAGAGSGNWIIPFGDIQSALQSFFGGNIEGKKRNEIGDLLKREGISYDQLRQAIKKLKEGGAS